MRVRVIRPSVLLLLSFCPTLLARADDLSNAARSAEGAIRRHQQPAGYWLTAYTSAARFENPKPEMNTYLTSVMVGLLDPIAARARLAETVAKARRHLRAQIEETGLVRYHGRPGSAAIRAGLGCVITPDSDDTVLAWLFAPSPDRARLERALEVLNEYEAGGPLPNLAGASAGVLVSGSGEGSESRRLGRSDARLPAPRKRGPARRAGALRVSSENDRAREGLGLQHANEGPNAACSSRGRWILTLSYPM